MIQDRHWFRIGLYLVLMATLIHLIPAWEFPTSLSSGDLIVSLGHSSLMAACKAFPASNQWYNHSLFICLLEKMVVLSFEPLFTPKGHSFGWIPLGILSLTADYELVKSPL